MEILVMLSESMDFLVKFRKNGCILFDLNFNSTYIFMNILIMVTKYIVPISFVLLTKKRKKKKKAKLYPLFSFN
jgi:hypothetical protein